MRIYLAVLLLAASAAFATDAPRPPWLDTEVLKAALAIELTEEQKPQFQQAVSDLVNNRAKAFNKLLRRNNVTNLERKMKTASSRQFNKMDKAMAGFLSDAQFPRYEVYRDLLEQKMIEAAKERTRTGDAAAEGARMGVLGNSGQQ